MARIEVTAGLETWSVYSVYLDHNTANKNNIFNGNSPQVNVSN